ncbi:MAG: fibrobacter succinogenes major paralogous domain-containing protein, partial [Prevotellaceae bacterium]|nr:fibrobacter succinogenes major paralogous domain-containing protein [Prevotellaceae bacterium]
ADENAVSTVDLLLFRPDGTDRRFYRTVSATLTDATTHTFQANVPVGTYDVELLTNAHSLISDAGLIPDELKATALARLTRSLAAGTRWTDSAIPAWAELANQSFTEALNLTGDKAIRPVRMLARIDVKLSTTAAGTGNANFALHSVRLYNYSTRGALCPDLTVTGLWNSTGNTVTLPSRPAGAATDAAAYLPATYVAKSADNTATGALLFNADDDTDGYLPDSLVRAVYTFEAPAGSAATPETNTCLVIGGYYKGSTTETYYRVDLKSDAGAYLPLLRNHLYRVTITHVDHAGEPTPDDGFSGDDSGITATLGDWDTSTTADVVGTPPPGSNCYMIHPRSDRAVTLDVPLDRINEYWGGTADGYGSAGGAPNSSPNCLKPGDGWTASVLWTDLTGITDANLIKASNSYFTRDYFTVSVPANCPDGNFVVAVKNASGTILWSWHIWVTQYNPDEYDGTGWAVKTSYPVTGGQVDSYAGDLWQSGGALYQKVMMDRDLGAIEGSTPTSAGASETARGQLYYQFGRKDPFPASLDGTSTLQSDGSGAFPTPVAGYTTIAASVQTPTTFYTSSDNWTNEATGIDYLWQDPNVPKTSGAKSVYDPCPAGWRLPLYGVWSDFSTSTGQGTTPVGITYATANSSVFYAAVGAYDYSLGGGLCDIGKSGYYWSATPDSEHHIGYGMFLWFYSWVVNLDSSTIRAVGISVRCSQQ